MPAKSLRFGVFDNVLLAPVVAQRPVMRGGLAEPHKLPRYCRHQYGYAVKHEPLHIDEADIAVLKSEDGRPFIYGGMLSRHFGHFTAEHVHRLWLAGRPEFRDATVVYVTSPGGRKPSTFFSRCMQHFGINNCIILDRPTRVEKLAIAEQGKILQRVQHPAYEGELERIAAARPLADPTRPRKVALTRGHWFKGRILCEATLGDYLEKEGYQLYRPEDHDLTDQLATLYNAEKVVITDGSACHLFDLLPKLNCEVAFLARRAKTKLDQTSIGPKVRRLVSFKDVSLLACPSNENGAEKKSHGLAYVPFDDVIAFLAKHGFVERHTQAIGQLPYFEDFRNYAKSNLTDTGNSTAPRDLIIEHLVTRLHETSKEARDLEERLAHSGLGFWRMKIKNALRAVRRLRR